MGERTEVDTMERGPLQSSRIGEASPAEQILTGMHVATTENGLQIVENLSSIEPQTARSEIQAQQEVIAPIDFDAIFGLHKGSISEIKKMFRSLARKYHPDTDASVGATRRMQELNDAYKKAMAPFEKKVGETQVSTETQTQVQPSTEARIKEAEKIETIFTSLGFPAEQLPAISSSTLAHLSQETSALTLYEDEAEWEPREGKELDPENPDWRTVAMWFTIAMMDTLFNKGRGIEMVMEQFLQRDGMKDIFRWVGIGDTDLLDNFLSHPEDMAKALKHLPEHQLAILFEQFTGDQTYDLLAGLSDNERERFIHHGEYGHTHIEDSLRSHMLGLLSEKQRAHLHLGFEGNTAH